eukprot:1195955-Prorocentrum_minimum.AAC.3
MRADGVSAAGGDPGQPPRGSRGHARSASMSQLLSGPSREPLWASEAPPTPDQWGALRPPQLPSLLRRGGGDVAHSPNTGEPPAPATPTPTPVCNKQSCAHAPHPIVVVYSTS